jgi:hypothetical protein
MSGLPHFYRSVLRSPALNLNFPKPFPFLRHIRVRRQATEKVELSSRRAVLESRIGSDVFDNYLGYAMQRLRRAAHRGLGLSAFLFLSLAIIPVSLRTLGVQVSISPRLSAAIDVWRQVGDVFGSGYQSGAEPASEPAVTPSETACPQHEFACLTEESYAVLDAMPVCGNAADPQPPRANRVRREHHVKALRSSQDKRIEPVIDVEAVKASFENHTRALQALSDLKMEKLKYEEFSWETFQPRDLTWRLPVRQSLKVLLLQVKTPAGTSPERCKVRAAASGERQRETTMPIDPDYCDL